MVKYNRLYNLEKECDEIQLALLKNVFAGHNNGMKHLEIGLAQEYTDSKKLENVYALFYENLGNPLYLINPEVMFFSSQEEKINAIYHEMIHYYCYLKNIIDTQVRNGENYHTIAFQAAVRRNMGECICFEKKWGNNAAKLLPEAMQKVKEELKQYST